MQGLVSAFKFAYLAWQRAFNMITIVFNHMKTYTWVKKLNGFVDPKEYGLLGKCMILKDRKFQRICIAQCIGPNYCCR